MANLPLDEPPGEQVRLVVRCLGAQAVVTPALPAHPVSAEPVRDRETPPW